MNPVLILSHNCLELTKKCVASVQAQDILTSIFVIDNGSTDGTYEWLKKQPLQCERNYINRGVSEAWNHGINYFFNIPLYTRVSAEVWDLHIDRTTVDHALCLNNDTVIPPHFYRSLLSCDVSFVTGASFTDMDAVMEPPTVALTDGPDFSAFLIRRSCWETVGPFDEKMVHYCSDIDYDIRARKLGIILHNSHVKFYHERSSTLRLATAEDRAAIQEQSNRDHQAFKEKYGRLPNQMMEEGFF